MSKRRGHPGQYVGLGVWFVLLAFDLWFVWAASSRAWSMAQADRGYHGSFTPSECSVSTRTSPPITTKNGQRDGRTSQIIRCIGSFTADAGWNRSGVSFVSDGETTVGVAARAVIARPDSTTVYAEGGSYAKYVVIAAVFAALPIVIVLVARRQRRTAPARPTRERRRAPTA